mmetsp:Transcript_12527/g.41526  ORF Transcript_12527/g.41526 Transcript_12527/m.41526 type:complete len:378 (+) Transcript_12527:303-1436(+)
MTPTSRGRTSGLLARSRLRVRSAEEAKRRRSSSAASCASAAATSDPWGALGGTAPLAASASGAREEGCALAREERRCSLGSRAARRASASTAGWARPGSPERSRQSSSARRSSREEGRPARTGTPSQKESSLQCLSPRCSSSAAHAHASATYLRDSSGGSAGPPSAPGEEREAGSTGRGAPLGRSVASALSWREMRHGPPRPPCRYPRVHSGLTWHWPPAASSAVPRAAVSAASKSMSSRRSGSSASCACSADCSCHSTSRRRASECAIGCSFSGSSAMLRSSSHACRWCSIASSRALPSPGIASLSAGGMASGSSARSSGGLRCTETSESRRKVVPIGPAECGSTVSHDATRSAFSAHDTSDGRPDSRESKKRRKP